MIEEKYQLLVDRATKELLRHGKYPTISQLMNIIQKYGSSQLELPLFSPIIFEPRSKIPIDEMNLQLGNIHFDITFLHRVILNLSKKTILRNNMILSDYEQYIKELDIVKSQLQNLLLISNQSSGYLDGSTIDFTTLQDIDPSSTANINTNESSVSLNETPGKTQVNPTSITITKEDTSWMIDGSSFPVNYTETGTAEKVLNPDSGTWSIKTINTPIAFKLSNKDMMAVNAISIAHSLNFEAEVVVQYSQDSVNWITISTPKSKLSAKNLKMNFETIYAKKIRIGFKPLTDKDSLQWSFQNISLIKSGYEPQADVITDDISPSSLDGISALSITTDDEIQPSTSIRYFVKPSDEDDFIPIMPTNSKNQGNKIVSFAEGILSSRFNNEFTADSGNVYWYSTGLSSDVSSWAGQGSAPTPGLRNNDIFKVQCDGTHAIDIDSDIQHDSALLHRGVYGWSVNDVSKVDKKVETNSFDMSGSQSKFDLYSIIEDEIVTNVDSANNKISLSKRTSSIEKIVKLPSSDSNSTANGTDGKTLRMSVDNKTKTFFTSTSLLSGLSSRHELNDFIGHTIFIDGYSYTISSVELLTDTERDSLGLGPSETAGLIIDEILDEEDSIIFQIRGQEISLSNLTIEDNKRTVAIDWNVTVESGDIFQVTYKALLEDMSNPKISNVNAYIKRSDGTNRELFPGREKDYYLEGKSIVIDDSITDVVYVSYSYESTSKQVVEYSTFITTASETRLDFSSISIDSFEYAAIISKEEHDLTKNNNIILQKGTHQVIVRSSPVSSAGVLDTDSAMYKVVNLQDSYGNYIFDRGRYFDLMIASIDTLEYVPEYALLHDIKKYDRSFFSLDDSNNILLNFNPFESNDMLYLYPGGASVTSHEVMQLEYKYKPEEQVQSVNIKAILYSKNSQYTPIINSISVKFI